MFGMHFYKSLSTFHITSLYHEKTPLYLSRLVFLIECRMNTRIVSVISARRINVTHIFSSLAKRPIDGKQRSSRAQKSFLYLAYKNRSELRRLRHDLGCERVGSRKEHRSSNSPAERTGELRRRPSEANRTARRQRSECQAPLRRRHRRGRTDNAARSIRRFL